MEKIQEDKYNEWIWNTKHISAPDEDWFIVKKFKTKRQILPIQEQRNIIESKMEYFWEYIPETELIETENWEYTIRQKFIKWKTLNQIDISNLSAETLRQLIDLIKKYLQYYKEQGWDLDLTGYQHYKWNPSHLERMIRNFLKINKNFLVSTNIMVGDDWNVYMIDVCESAEQRLAWKIKNFCAKPFIKRTIYNLEKALQKRVNFENKNIKDDLLDTLS